MKDARHDGAATLSPTSEEAAELVATRRDLHAHPELAYRETRTARVVAVLGRVFR